MRSLLSKTNDLFQENRWLVICFGLWLAAGAVVLSSSPQGALVLYFSEHRTPFWNIFFKYTTKGGEEIIYIVAAVLALFIRYRSAITVPLLGIAVTIVSFITKKLFHHPRPLAYYQNLGLVDQLTFVEGVRVNGGPTSFPSGHTMGGFAVFTFLALILPYKRSVAVVLFGMAVFVGISRVYLVQHFFKDVYLGSILGVLLAMLFYQVQFSLGKKQWLDGYLLPEHKKRAR